MVQCALETNCGVWDAIYSGRACGPRFPDTGFVSVFEAQTGGAGPLRVLDYGFGGAANMMHLLRRGHEVSGVEISRACIEAARTMAASCGFAPDLRYYEGGALPFPDDAFDVVSAWLVLGYNTWQTLETAVREIERVLRPGGLFIGTMTAPDDITPVLGKALGDATFVSTMPGQAEAVVLAPERAELGRCFPGRALRVGGFSHALDGWHGHHWIVTYDLPGDGAPVAPAQAEGGAGEDPAALYPEDNFVRLAHRQLPADRYPNLVCLGGAMAPEALCLAGKGHAVTLLDPDPRGLGETPRGRCLVESGLGLRPWRPGRKDAAPEPCDGVVAWLTLPREPGPLSEAVRELEAALKPGGVFLAALDAGAAQSYPGGPQALFPGGELALGSFEFSYGETVKNYLVVRHVRA